VSVEETLARKEGGAGAHPKGAPPPPTTRTCATSRVQLGGQLPLPRPPHAGRGAAHPVPLCTAAPALADHVRGRSSFGRQGTTPQSLSPCCVLLCAACLRGPPSNAGRGHNGMAAPVSNSCLPPVKYSCCSSLWQGPRQAPGCMYVPHVASGPPRHLLPLSAQWCTGAGASRGVIVALVQIVDDLQDVHKYVAPCFPP